MDTRKKLELSIVIILILIFVLYAYTTLEPSLDAAPPVAKNIDSETVASSTGSTFETPGQTELETVAEAPESTDEIVHNTEKSETIESKKEISAPTEEQVVDEPVSTLNLKQAHRNTLVSTHNAARVSKGIPPLIWSSTVAASAQAWANVLADQSCALTHSSGLYGENLYYMSSSRDILEFNPSQAVAAWLAEESDYSYQNNSCAAGKVCGHYTQAVWANSTELGCGVSTCSENGMNTQLWVCQYNPPGNYIGQKPY